MDLNDDSLPPPPPPPEDEDEDDDEEVYQTEGQDVVRDDPTAPWNVQRPAQQTAGRPSFATFVGNMEQQSTTMGQLGGGRTPTGSVSGLSTAGGGGPPGFTAAGGGSVRGSQAGDRSAQASNIPIHDIKPLDHSEFQNRPEEWRQVTRNHYKRVLAKCMSSSTDGYITNQEHLNKLAELRLIYGLTHANHQELYAYCKRLFDQHQKQKFELDVLAFSSPNQIRGTLRTKQKEAEIARKEREFEQYQMTLKREQALNNAQESGARRLNPTNKITVCQACDKDTPATYMVLPCRHICLCSACKRTNKKCPHCHFKADAVVPADNTGIFVRNKF